MLLGYIDRIENNTVAGWIWDSDKPQETLFVELCDPDGHVILERACLFREDLLKAGFGDGYYGFSVSFPDREIPLDQTPLSVTANVPGRNYQLRNALEKNGTVSDKLRRLYRSYFRARSFPDPAAAEEPLGRDITSVIRPRRQTEDGQVTGVNFAKINQVEGGHIDVWIDGKPDEVAPIVMVGDKPAWQSPEVHELVGVHDFTTAYRFSTSGMQKGAEISLWTASTDQIYLSETRQAAQSFLERSVMQQMAAAARIAARPGAVAVTCWDGGHNPVGRAKVLLDVLKPHRPAVLFCFLNDDFGTDIWPPLSNATENIVLIPWSNRFFYFRMARAMGLRFDTVWMCKPRAQTFHLAALLAAPEGKLVLDMDDNEEHFSRSSAGRDKPYGLPSIGMSRLLMQNVPARTAASISLVEDFDAVMVRHARVPAPEILPRPGQSNGGPLKIGFIGTVRPHKQLLSAARAIRAMSEAGPQSFEFHVYGDVQPASLCEDLAAEGVVIRHNIPFDALRDQLQRMDIILSGYPSDRAQDAAITRYQISSKIGDALSVGRPVLVPDGPSVADLGAVPGVHLFTSETFTEALTRAATETGPVELPEDFTMAGAYDRFAEAEKRAEAAPRAAQALALLPSSEILAREDAPDDRPTLLLIWKQHDVGLYGRRIDQLCRSYRQQYPDHRVVVLEILHKDSDGGYRQPMPGFSEFTYIRELNIRKSEGCLQDRSGTEFRQIRIDTTDMLNSALTEFLVAHKIMPTRTVVVLFPNIFKLERVFDVLNAYPLIIDVVDNQMGWARGRARVDVLRQYFMLCRMGHRVVFNSELNHAHFKALGLLEREARTVEVIPNWYQLPEGFTPKGRTETGSELVQLVYTGNMNDRIDWALMRRLVQLDERIRLHLAGEARRSSEVLADLLEDPRVIYHGPLAEEQTLQLLSMADLAVIPHVVDEVSTFMNPLKARMYEAVGLPAVASNVPGLSSGPALTVVEDQEAFLAEVAKHLKTRPPHAAAAAPDALAPEALAYIRLIDALRHEASNDDGQTT